MTDETPPRWRRTMPGRAMTWLSVALLATLLTGVVAVFAVHRLAVEQRELEVRGELIDEINRASVQTVQDSRSTRPVEDGFEEGLEDGFELEPQVGEAADGWLQVSATITPRVRFYYGKDSEAAKRWDDYQVSVRDWIQLDGTGRADVQLERAERLRDFVGETSEEPPGADPWRLLATDPEAPALVRQWAGRAVLEQLEPLLEELRDAAPRVD